MTLTIDLTPEMESALQEKARDKGVEPTDLVRHIMAIYLALDESGIVTPHSPGKTSELLELALSLHDQGKSNLFLQSSTSERLQSIKELTRVAHEIIPQNASTSNWSREEIYEGELERILGDHEDQS